MSASTLQNYENDATSPTVDFLVRFASAVGVTPGWILDGAAEGAAGDGAAPTGRPGGDQIVGNDTEASLPPSDPNGLLRPLSASPAYADRFTLTVYTHVEASAGDGLFGWEPSDDDDVVEVDHSKRVFAELLGFWPPDDMRGVRVRGDSMRRARGGIVDGQIVLYRPVGSAADVEDGARYVLTVSEGEESRVLVKRVQLLTGGGLRLIADNPGVGVRDEVLVPSRDGLVNKETGQSVHLQFLGVVVWPDDHADEAAVRAVGRTLDHLIARGYLPAPPSA